MRLPAFANVSEWPRLLQRLLLLSSFLFISMFVFTFHLREVYFFSVYVKCCRLFLSILLSCRLSRKSTNAGTVELLVPFFVNVVTFLSEFQGSEENQFQCFLSRIDTLIQNRARPVLRENSGYTTSLQTQLEVLAFPLQYRPSLPLLWSLAGIVQFRQSPYNAARSLATALRLLRLSERR